MFLHRTYKLTLYNAKELENYKLVSYILIFYLIL